MQEEEPVNFYFINEPYGEFNNIYPSQFTHDGKVYKSNEHYFQSQKFAGTPKELYVIEAPTPDDAFDRGNERTHPLREDWQDVKESVMRAGLTLKFNQNPDLKAKLLATGNRKIVEHTVNDSYWGDGGDGSGKNRLGFILMELREKFRQTE